MRDVSAWQINYYEHIVRDERDLGRIREYIAANPFRWEYDRENPSCCPVMDSWVSGERIWFSKRNLKSSYD